MRSSRSSRVDRVRPPAAAASPRRQLAAQRLRPAPASPARASRMRASARSARSARSERGIQIDDRRRSVRAAAARSRDLLLLDLGDAEQQLRALGDVGRAVGARVQQRGQVGPRLGLRSGSAPARSGPPRRAGISARSASASARASAGRCSSREATRSDRRSSHSRSSASPGPASALPGAWRTSAASAPHSSASPASRSRSRWWPRRWAPTSKRAPPTGTPAPFDPRRCSAICRASLRMVRRRLGSSRDWAGSPLVDGPAQQHLVGRQQARPLLRRPVQRHQRLGRAAGCSGRRPGCARRPSARARADAASPAPGPPPAPACACAPPDPACGRPARSGCRTDPRSCPARRTGAPAPRSRPPARRSRAGRAMARAFCGCSACTRWNTSMAASGGAQLLVQQHAPALQQRQPRRPGSFCGVQALPIEDLGQRRPAPLAIVQRHQRRQRLGVALVDRQHQVPEVDRLLGVAQALERDARRLGQAFPPLAGGTAAAPRAGSDSTSARQVATARVDVARGASRASASVGIGLEDLLQAGTAFWCLPSLSIHSAAIRRCRADALRRRRRRRRPGGSGCRSDRSSAPAPRTARPAPPAPADGAA